MKKFFSRHKVLIISAIAALVFVFLFIPFIVVSIPAPMGINACPYMGKDSQLCSLDQHITLLNYIQNQEPIVQISWELLLIAYVISFIIFYGEIRLFLNIIKPQKTKKKLSSLILKVLKLAVLVFIPLSIILIFEFFGISL